MPAARFSQASPGFDVTELEHLAATGSCGPSGEVGELFGVTWAGQIVTSTLSEILAVELEVARLGARLLWQWGPLRRPADGSLDASRSRPADMVVRN